MENPALNVAAAKQEQPVEGNLLGSVIIDAPDKAFVFMNGVPKGRGRVVLDHVDRFMPFWVRVHLKDHDPWSTQVRLNGATAVKVQPDLY